MNEHNPRLGVVFERLRDAGLALNKEQAFVQCLGHHIFSEGLRKLDVHDIAILNAPPPTNVTEVKSFVFLVFPLQFIKTNRRFIWSSRHFIK